MSLAGLFWLRPLKSKRSKEIASELKRGGPLGPPLFSEFKGDVKRLCRKMQVKMIHSRPYLPQSQGKVERSHRALRLKYISHASLVTIKTEI